MADSLSSITGLSSGMDWRSLVDQVMTLERRPAAALEAKVTANTKRRDALAQFGGLVKALKSAADRLTGAAADSPLNAFTVQAAGTGANDRSVLAATATAGAEPGAYDVSVTALAAAQRWTGAAGVTPNAALPQGGTLAIGRAGGTGTPATLAVDASWTPARLRDEINKLNTGATPTGVAASLVTVSATEQRLVLTSTQAGAANAFTLDDGGTGLRAALGLDDAALAAAPALRQDASDAEFTVGGVAMTRATNTASDAIPGVTLTLSTPGDATVTVARQTSAGAEAMQGFANAYNAVQKFVQAQGADRANPLYNDPLLRGVRSGLGQTAVGAATPASQAGGAAGVADDLTTLSALGLSLQKDGTLEFTSAAYTSAAAARPDDLRALLAARMGAFAAQADAMTRPVTGLIAQRDASLTLQSAAHTDRVADIDARLEKRRAALVAQYAKFESSLSRLKSIGEQMTAQFTALNNSNSSK